MKLETAFAQFPVLETARLSLRSLLISDASAILDLYGDERVMRYHPEPVFTSETRAHRFIQFCQRAFLDHRLIRWGVALKACDHIIGTVGMHNIDVLNDHVEIGFDIVPGYWRCGYGAEAVRAVLGFAFDVMAINRIEAHTMLDNGASIQLLQKLGFQFEGILRQYGFWKGVFHDIRMFSFLRKDYGGDVPRDAISGQIIDTTSTD